MVQMSRFDPLADISSIPYLRRAMQTRIPNSQLFEELDRDAGEGVFQYKL